MRAFPHFIDIKEISCSLETEQNLIPKERYISILMSFNHLEQNKYLMQLLNMDINAGF